MDHFPSPCPPKRAARSRIGYRLLAIGYWLNGLLYELRAALLRSAKRVGGWLRWNCYTEIRCGWCNPPRVTRRAWIKPRQHSDGMCPACAQKFTLEAQRFLDSRPSTLDPRPSTLHS